MPVITVIEITYAEDAERTLTAPFTFYVQEDVWAAYPNTKEEAVSTTMDALFATDEPQSFKWLTGDLPSDIFANHIGKLVESGRLVLEQSGIPTILEIVAHCVRNNCLYKFYDRIAWLTRNEKDQIWLYKDGVPASMSLGLMFKNRLDYGGGNYSSAMQSDKAYMYGGLIYHYATQDWSTHT